MLAVPVVRVLVRVDEDEVRLSAFVELKAPLVDVLLTSRLEFVVDDCDPLPAMLEGEACEDVETGNCGPLEPLGEATPPFVEA